MQRFKLLTIFIYSVSQIKGGLSARVAFNTKGVYFGPLENGGGVLGGREKWGECTRLREKMGGVRI